ncbi:MAG: HAD family phosphatase [Candidatus Riflebacteria bacterium]|nr:HAD family phosphatase [Candidatus Riflebacteria bacterium]
MSKGAIFDMDGVLADTEPAYIEVNRRFLTACGVDFSKLDYSEFIGISAPLMWGRLKERYSLPQTVEWLIANEHDSFNKYVQAFDSLPHFTGIDKLLNRLSEQNYRISIASSSFRKNVDLVLNKTGLRKYFHEIVSGEEVVNGKPAPDIFLLAAKKLNLSPSECFVIEDSNNGLRGAIGAGMKCIGFRNPTSGNQDLSAATFLIDDFSDSVIEKIISFQ